VKFICWSVVLFEPPASHRAAGGGPRGPPWRSHPGPGGPGRTPVGGARAPGTRRWDAGARPGRMLVHPDRGRPRGRFPGHWRRLAATLVSLPAADIPHRCEPVP